MQQYKPAYFYVVDELDAALDKKNSTRLAEMLAKSSSQFLMVTHNNNMLKFMDSAIGVSMTKGVSHIVGVRFNGETAQTVPLAPQEDEPLDEEIPPEEPAEGDGKAS